MGVLYSNGISSGDIGGAVAEAVLHDIRVNGLGLLGFPQIHVKRAGNDGFAIRIQFESNSRTFEISNAEALRSVKMMKSERGYNPEIFDRVQHAAACLEGCK